ncbi:MAG: hypothetical protein QM636_08510, partial [Rhizobium sp.]
AAAEGVAGADPGFMQVQALVGTGTAMFGYAENGGPGSDKGLNLHEARIGARYTFGGCQTASYMPPADIPVQPVYK